MHRMEALALSPTSWVTPPRLDEVLIRALEDERQGLARHAGLERQFVLAVVDLLRTTLQRVRQVDDLHQAAAAPVRTAPRDAPPPCTTVASLSPRERDVLERIAAGESNKAIARALSLSPHTVKRHVANILDKLDARSRAQAVACLRQAP
jgi:DNA-binding NarL/FixJ family response regulator